MIGYILMGLGAYLIYDDYREAKAKKLLKGGKNGKLLENGSRGARGNSNRKPGADGQKPDRKRGVIGVPAKSKGANENELSEGVIQPNELDAPGDSLRDDSGGKPDEARDGSQTKGVKANEGDVRAIPDSKGGQENAGDQNNSENGNGDDGDDVRA